MNADSVARADGTALSARCAFALVLCIAFLANVLRNVSTQLPHQLSDEAVFLLGSKYFLQWDLIQSLGYVPYPGLLFLKLGSLLVSSEHHYALMKVWNALCLAGSAIPAYMVARDVMPPREAATAGLLVAIAPPTIYGAYFTPEATYILAFWIFAALATAALRTPRRYGLAMATGVTGGVAYLIKPHALALVVGYAVAAIVLYLRAHTQQRSRGGTTTAVDQMPACESDWPPRVLATNLACFTISTVVALVLLGRIFGSTWLAAFDVRIYSNLVDGTTTDTMEWKTLRGFATLLALHGAAIVACAAVPLALLAVFAVHRGSVKGNAPVMVAFVASTLAMLVLMTVKASIDFYVIYGGSNTLDRLNVRYYSYALPLVIFAAIARVPERATERISMRKAGRAGLTAAAAIACMLLVQRQSFTFVDAPDLMYLHFDRTTAVAAVVVLAAAMGLALRQIPLRWLILAGWGAMSVLSVYAAWRLQENEDRVQLGDRAVDVLRGLFRADELDHGIIVKGSNPVAAARATFRLASRSPTVLTLQDAHARIGSSTQWILALGDLTGTSFDLPSIRAVDSTIYLARGTRHLVSPAPAGSGAVFAFNSGAVARAIARPSHAPEPWGTWLAGTTARVTFAETLPERAELVIVANVLDPQLQGPVTVTLCEKDYALPLTATLAEYRLPYSCAGRPHELQFSGMQPVAPRDIGWSNDARALSLALSEIRVENGASTR